MKGVVVIPARYASTRLPGKPLMKICGREMILHVAQRAAKASSVSRVCVATDDRRIAQVVEKAGFEAIMTRDDHKSGTDRIAEAARKIDAEIFVNVQGDEPLIDPEHIDRAVEPLLADSNILMGSLKTPLDSREDLFNPNCVKVVVDAGDFALYFSRSPIPFVRGAMDLRNSSMSQNGTNFYKHIGIYIYRKEFLLRFAARGPGKLEKAESLEQLRALEMGVRIKVPTVDRAGPCVDTPEDLERVEKLMEAELKKIDLDR